MPLSVLYMPLTATIQEAKSPISGQFSQLLAHQRVKVASEHVRSS